MIQNTPPPVARTAEASRFTLGTISRAIGQTAWPTAWSMNAFCRSTTTSAVRFGSRSACGCTTPQRAITRWVTPSGALNQVMAVSVMALSPVLQWTVYINGGTLRGVWLHLVTGTRLTTRGRVAWSSDGNKTYVSIMAKTLAGVWHAQSSRAKSQMPPRPGRRAFPEAPVYTISSADVVRANSSHHVTDLRH